jgi:hypothetical protein
MRILGHMAAAAFGILLLLPAQASASRAMWSIFEDHTALVKAAPAQRQAMLAQVRNHMGADTLRIEVKWNEVAPQPTARSKPRFDASDPAQYQGSLHAYPSFGPYDDLVRRARAFGLRVLITITGDAPRWATAGGRGRSFTTANWKVDAGEYGKFAAAVAKRYSGRFPGLPAVHHYSIWNEPNHRNFLKPTSQAPRLYRNMVNEALPQVHRHGPGGARVFVGELAPVGRAPRAMGPKQFFRRWLCLNRRLKRTSRGTGCRKFKRIDADAFAHHPYGPTARVPRKRDVINMLAIRTLGKYLDAARRAKRFTRRLNIYNTEFGLQSNPPDRVVSTSLSRQAALINEKEEYAYRYWRLKSHSQYLMLDDPARPGPASVKWSGFQTGLRFAGGSRKPAYNAYRFPIVVERRRRGVYVWGRVRPAAGHRYVRLQRKGGSYGPRIKTNSRGYFGVRRRIAGRYRFKAYDGGGNLIGRSRTAKPIR